MMDVTIVVGTIGQSIMRSEDGGVTWARLGPRRGFPYEASVRCLAVHPRRSNIIFAGTQKGLFRSDDRGATWNCVDSVLNAYNIWALAFDPVNPDRVFAGSGTPTPAGLFRSLDGGNSWERRPVEIAETCENVGTPRVTGIAVDPVEPDNVWMGLEVDGARHSADGGESWRLVEATGHQDIHNVAVTAGPPGTVLIMGNREIYASTDKGATWETLGMQTNLPWEHPRTQNYLRGIAVDPADPRRLLLGFGDFTPGSSGAVAQSVDLGKTWALLELPVEPNSTIWTFGVNPADAGTIFAASRYGYLYRTDDSGASWSKLKRELSEIAAVCWLPN